MKFKEKREREQELERARDGVSDTYSPQLHVSMTHPDTHSSMCH